MLGELVLLPAGDAPRADDNLRLPEDATKLVDDGRLDLRRGYAANRACPGPLSSTSWLLRAPGRRRCHRFWCDLVAAAASEAVAELPRLQGEIALLKGEAEAVLRRTEELDAAE